MSEPTLILVCDDEAPMRQIVAAKLRELGFEVMEGRDGREGFDLASKRAPRLVVTDYQMPRMSGLEMAQGLKAANATSATPVIMLTARGYVLTPEQIATTGIVHLMPKPFGVRQLMARVQQVLGLADKAAA